MRVVVVTMVMMVAEMKVVSKVLYPDRSAGVFITRLILEFYVNIILKLFINKINTSGITSVSVC